MSNSVEVRLNKIIEALLSDYKSDEGRVIDRMDVFNQPDKEVIYDIMGKLQNIILPGYYKNKVYRVYTTKNNLSMLIEDVTYNLKKQIAIVLKNDTEDADSRAEELTLEFLSKLPRIREYIETDLQAAYDGDPAAYSMNEIIFSYPGFYAIMINRLAHELYKLSVPIIPRIMTERAHSLTGIDIHPGATLGKYFFIDHGTGIVIGETTIIGDNVKVYQGVTLGALSTRGGQKLKSVKRHPTIEDNVTIYSGASILGGETVVGKNSVIGSNAFITTSVGEGTRVSIKNQELCFSHKSEFGQNDSWCYII
jgi:serine O-acetyltransferase